MNTSAEQSLLRMFGSGLGQHARLLALASAQQRHLPQSLVVEQVRGREAVNELFVFDVDALSVSTDLDLDIFLGEELTLGLLQPDSSRRAWHGLCTEAAWQGADGGLARYRLRMEPSLALLKHRRDCFVFQDMNTQAIVSELLPDYPQVRFRFDVSQQAPQRAIVTQYRESDFDFLARVLAADGWNWRFEHDQDSGSDDQPPDGQARHRVVFFDSSTVAPTTPGSATIRFHGVRATEVDDTIDQLRAHRAVQANAVGISSWDPKQVHAPAAAQLSRIDAGALPELEVYDGSGERIATDNSEAHSELMLRAFEMDNKRFSGAGAVRRLAAGHGFELTQHDRFPGGDNRFTVLSIEHEARNNLGAQIKGTRHATEAGTYRNTFVCVRDSVPIVDVAGRYTPECRPHHIGTSGQCRQHL